MSDPDWEIYTVTKGNTFEPEHITGVTITPEKMVINQARYRDALPSVTIYGDGFEKTYKLEEIQHFSGSYTYSYEEV